MICSTRSANRRDFLMHLDKKHRHEVRQVYLLHGELFLFSGGYREDVSKLRGLWELHRTSREARLPVNLSGVSPDTFRGDGRSRDNNLSNFKSCQVLYHLLNWGFTICRELKIYE